MRALVERDETAVSHATPAAALSAAERSVSLDLLPAAVRSLFENGKV